MKRLNYESPSTEVIEIETEGMILQGSGGSGNVPDFGDGGNA